MSYFSERREIRMTRHLTDYIVVHMKGRVSSLHTKTSLCCLSLPVNSPYAVQTFREYSSSPAVFTVLNASEEKAEEIQLSKALMTGKK